MTTGSSSTASNSTNKTYGNHEITTENGLRLPPLNGLNGSSSSTDVDSNDTNNNYNKHHHNHSHHSSHNKRSGSGSDASSSKRTKLSNSSSSSSNQGVPTNKYGGVISNQSQAYDVMQTGTGTVSGMNNNNNNSLSSNCNSNGNNNSSCSGHNTNAGAGHYNIMEKLKELYRELKGDKTCKEVSIFLEFLGVFVLGPGILGGSMFRDRLKLELVGFCVNFNFTGEV